ncbi:MAG TPA: hypothetical protein VFM87_08695 [Agrococcus sp.]|nr:hypothetical protein [Agrococcus sp.]
MTMTLERAVRSGTTMGGAGRMTRGGAQMALDKTGNERIPLAMVEPRIVAGQVFMSGRMRGSVGPDGRYTVWSYHEPIAGQTADGDWWITAARFSKTTTRHQNVVRRALASLGIEPLELR